METKLKELQEELLRVDREFLEEEAKKQVIFETTGAGLWFSQLLTLANKFNNFKG